MRRLALRLSFAAAPVLAGCGSSVFACVDDDACPGGTCQSNGFCSFPDGECSSGERYGAHAPAAFAGECVGEASTGMVGPSESSDSIGSTTAMTVDSTFTTDPTATSTTGVVTTSPETTLDTTADATADGSTGMPADCEVVEFMGNDDGDWEPVSMQAGVSISNGVVSFEVDQAGGAAMLLDQTDVVGWSFAFDFLAGPNPEAPLALGVTTQSFDSGSMAIAELRNGTLTIGGAANDGSIDAVGVFPGFDAGALEIRVAVQRDRATFRASGWNDPAGYDAVVLLDDAPGLVAVGAYADVDITDPGTPRLERITICPL